MQITHATTNTAIIVTIHNTGKEFQSLIEIRIIKGVTPSKWYRTN